MDFGWSSADTELYDESLAFARGLRESADTRGGAPRFSRALWDRCGEFGLLGLSVPEADGGSGLGALSTARVLEAFGRGFEDLGLLFSASAHLFACAMPIVEHGSDEAKVTLVPRLATGAAIGANAITEAEAGSDAFALRTRAVRDGDGYRLTGAKSYVTNGPIADVVVVYASTSPEHGYLGVTAFCVPADVPGIHAGEPFHKMGLTSSPISSLYLDDCLVPARYRLGREGEGARIFHDSMRWERACLFAMYVGAMERQLEQVIAHAKGRRQYRKPIGKLQAVAHRVADMALRLEAARLLLYRACWALDRNEGHGLAIPLAKLAVSEAAIRSSLDAVQLHGGAGYVTEMGVERMLRDAIPATIFSGTSEVQRDLVARELGL
jgi:alkylation response protein AidB-like acyl-CoA dehydrogenase